MKKIQISVPSGIKYLSDWDKLWELLPNDRAFILNKRICGCGATEMYIRSDKKVILAGPRKHLLYNKYSQHLPSMFDIFLKFGVKSQDLFFTACLAFKILLFVSLKTVKMKAVGKMLGILVIK